MTDQARLRAAGRRATDSSMTSVFLALAADAGFSVFFAADLGLDGFFATAGASANCPRLFFSAAIRSMTLPRSGLSGSSASIPSPLSLAYISARRRVS